MKPFKMDFHTHSSFSADSQAPMEDMVKAAMRKGVTHMSLTEHVDYDSDLNGSIVQWDFDKKGYMEAIKTLGDRYEEDIQLFKGLELGLQPHLAQRNNDLISQWDFDFIIGSLHTVNGRDLYHQHYFDSLKPADALALYYDDYYKSIEAYSGFDVLGHLDLYLRYSPRLKEVAFSSYEEGLTRLLSKVIQMGKGIEVNAGGYRYGLDATNPSEDILKCYKRLGGEIVTVGSDAHRPEDVAYAYDEIIAMLKRLDFKYVTYYSSRKPQYMKL